MMSSVSIILEFFIFIFIKFALADMVVARDRDVGTNDTQFVTRTHLANFLQIGDLALGFVEYALYFHRY